MRKYKVTFDFISKDPDEDQLGRVLNDIEWLTDNVIGDCDIINIDWKEIALEPEQTR